MDWSHWLEWFHWLFGAAERDIAWWQMAARAVLMAAYAILLFRFAARRIVGRGSVLDMMMAVIVGSALSRALTANAPLLPTVVATAVIVVIHAALAAWAARTSGRLSRILKGTPATLIRDGTVDWAAVRRAHLGKEDLLEALRLEGIADPSEVREACLERNGRISAVRR